LDESEISFFIIFSLYAVGDSDALELAYRVRSDILKVADVKPQHFSIPYSTQKSEERIRVGGVDMDMSLAEAQKVAELGRDSELMKDFSSAHKSSRGEALERALPRPVPVDGARD